MMSIALGEVDVNRWHTLGLFGGRVFCDDEDITERCRWFDDVNGLAEVLVVDDSGQPQLSYLLSEPQTRIIYGRIAVIP